MLDDIVNAADAAGSVTETSEEGLGQRLMNSFIGVIVGICLFLGSFLLLWWNEGNVIAEKDALNEMSHALVKGNAAKPDKALNGKLVHAAAKLESAEKIGDAPYLKPGPYLVLERNVEMYQWVEHSESKSKKKLGGSKQTTTTYSYKMEWKDGYEDSSHFKNQSGHVNPQPTVSAKKLHVQKSRFGKFDGAAILDHVSARQDLPVNTELTLADAKDPKKKPETRNGLVYVRKTPGKTGDQLGDQRISYKVVKPGVFSVIAKQAGTRFAAYTSKNGKEKFLVEAGHKAPQQMIQTAKEEAGTFAMILRVVGFVFMFVGMNLLAGPIVTLMDVVPFLGTASRFLLGVVFFVASLVLTAVTIVVSMIAHHPVVLVLSLLAAAGGGYYYWDKKKKGGAAPARVPNETAPAAGQNNRAA